MENDNLNSLFFIKSDILNNYLTKKIHRIDDNINSLNDNVSDTCWGQIHEVKVFIDSTYNGVSWRADNVPRI